MSTSHKSLSAVLLIVLLLFLSGGGGLAAMQTVSLPITIDYPLLRSLIVAHAFNGPEESVTLLDQGDGCIHLTLSSPRIEESEGTIRVEMKVAARTGMPLGGSCYTPSIWEGFLVLYQKPRLNPEDWSMSFDTIHSELLGGDRRPARVTGVLWDFVEPYIAAYLDNVSIDLMPPVNKVKEFLLPLFPADREPQVKEMLDSMRPGVVEVEPDSLYLPVLADVWDVYDPGYDKRDEVSAKQELERTIALWEQWDGLLVYLVTALTEKALNQAERQILVDVLLDTRHRFVAELEGDSIDHDIVRQQFISAWRDLAPIFRKHLVYQGEESRVLGYLAFFTSADALMVLDRIGPTLGVEISTTGLIRLVEMLNGDPDLIRYHQEPNPKLQELFQVEPQPERESDMPAAPAPLGLEERSSSLQPVLDFLFPQPAYAGSNPQPTMKKILEWKVPAGDVNSYISKVEKLLKASAASTLIKSPVPGSRVTMYRKLVKAMAWQESCFRQFVVRGEKLTYLLSYNRSSVGLMQINERVWRGVYDLNRLRWDIHYNASAGCQIAALYLNRYAMSAGSAARNLNDQTMARLVYAMYNGGPAQRTKFLKRHKSGKYYDSDRLFWEKYQMVDNGEVRKVSVCLTGS